MRERGVVVVGLNAGGFYAGDSEARIRKFIEETGVTFPVGIDEAGTYTEYEIGAAISPFPLDVVVNREGRIVFLAHEFNADRVRAAIEAEL